MRRNPWLLVLSLALVASCSRNERLVTRAPTAPEAGWDLKQVGQGDAGLMVERGTGFYPMSVGNRCRYASRDSEAIINNGNVTTRHAEGKIEVVQVRMERMHGQTYMREEIGIPDTILMGGGVRWRREDETGLYEFGPSPPGAPGKFEKKLLAYPLHVGATWTMYGALHDDTARVEGLDVLDLPAGRFPAWRIWIHGISQPARTVWYSRAGYLATKWHLESGRSAPGYVQVIKFHADSLYWLHLAEERR
jgi:hypothetical protein